MAALTMRNRVRAERAARNCVRAAHGGTVGPVGQRVAVIRAGRCSRQIDLSFYFSSDTMLIGERERRTIDRRERSNAKMTARFSD